MNNATHLTHPSFRIKEKAALRKEYSCVLESEMQVTVRESNSYFFKMDMWHGYLSPNADLAAMSPVAPNSSMIYPVEE